MSHDRAGLSCFLDAFISPIYVMLYQLRVCVVDAVLTKIWNEIIFSNSYVVCFQQLKFVTK